jgi:hypothetical protein
VTQPRSQEELYEIHKNEVIQRAPNLTDYEEGAINDANSGAASVAMSELTDLIIQQFAKTYFRSADGPEVTGGADDLETLAIDHFGDDFARPDATKSAGIVTFSRPTATAGDVIINAGTVVKTQADANGQIRRFETVLGVTLTGLNINASIEAVTGEEGPANNVEAGEIDQIETTLTDPTIVVTNAAATTGGVAEQDDATYREHILNLIKQLKGATKTALQAKLLTVAGVEQATVIEFGQNVIEWIDSSSTPVDDSFIIPRVRAFIADANGTANQALIDAAALVLDEVRACGVRVEIVGAVAIVLDWTGLLTLNPGGPNFATLSADTSLITEAMTKYLQDLAIGAGLNRNLARKAIMDEWGPDGTDDLADFVSTIPTADVDVDENERLIPGTISTT